MLFGSAFTGVGIAEDLSKGFVDRLRSLPMYQSAMLIGRTLSDLVRNLLTFFVMFVVGLAVGFRIEGIALEAIAATLLLLFFSYAFSWIQAFIGLSVNSVEAANSAGFIWMFPLTFVSSAFVETSTLPELAPADRRRQPVHDRDERDPRALQRPGPGQLRLAVDRVGDRDHRRCSRILSVRKYSQATSR